MFCPLRFATYDFRSSRYKFEIPSSKSTSFEFQVLGESLGECTAYAIPRGWPITRRSVCLAYPATPLHHVLSSPPSDLLALKLNSGTRFTVSIFQAPLEDPDIEV